MDKIIEKAWGHEEIEFNGPLCFKKLHLKKGYRCSVHHHKIKDEVFFIWSGPVLMEVDGKESKLWPGDMVHVLPGQKHRFTGLHDSIIYEFSTHDDPEDSYREPGQLSGKVEG